MNYLIAGLILLVWIYVAMSFAWSPGVKPAVNLTLGIMAIMLLGLIHWIPFWLIFMR